MHRRVEDERSGRGRMVSVSAAHRHWSRRAATGRLAQRLSEIRRLARLPVHGRQPVRRTVAAITRACRSRRSAVPISITAIRLPGRSASCPTRLTRCSACFPRTVPATVRRPSSQARRPGYVANDRSRRSHSTCASSLRARIAAAAARSAPPCRYRSRRTTSIPDSARSFRSPIRTNLLDNLADRDHAEGPVPQGRRGASRSGSCTRCPLASNQSALQWAQLNVTGGTVAAAAVQQQIYSPDTTLYRFMPSIAADNQGNVAIGFSTSGAARSQLPSHQVRRTPRGRPAQHSCRRRRSRSSPDSVRKRIAAAAAAVRAIAGATTRR